MNSFPLLHIIIITYDRYNQLDKTLQNIYPFLSQEIKLSVSDNNSLNEYQCEILRRKYPGVSILSHSFNIGSSLNYLFALDSSEGVYTWILCDDDETDFHNISSLLDDLRPQIYDIHMAGSSQIPYILPSTLNNRTLNISDMILWNPNNFLFHIGFVPSLIYKTSLLTSNVKQKVIDILPSFYPHIYLLLFISSASIKINNTNYVIKPMGDYGAQDEYLLQFIHSWLLMCRDADLIFGFNNHSLIKGIFPTPRSQLLRLTNATVCHANYKSYLSAVNILFRLIPLTRLNISVITLFSVIIFILFFPILNFLHYHYWRLRKAKLKISDNK